MTLAFRPQLSAVILFLSVATTALAETPTQEAGRHFSRGVELVQEGSFAEALIEFDRAYKISPNYSVLYNLGEAYVGLGKPVNAVDSFTKYLSEGGDKIPEARRADVLAEIRRQQARIANVTVTVDQNGATVSVDGASVGTSPLGAPIRVGIGTHRFSVSLPGYSAEPQQLELAGEDAPTLTFHLAQDAASVPAPTAPTAAPPVPAAPAPAAQPSPAPLEPRHDAPPTDSSAPAGGAWRAGGYGLAALGVVGLGLGTGFGLAAKGKASDRDAVAQRCGTACTAADVANATDLHHQAQKDATISSVGFIGGSVALAAGIVVLLTAPSNASSTQAGVRALPYFGPQGFGLQTGGSF